MRLRLLTALAVALTIAAPASAQVNVVREERAKVTAAPPIGTVQAFEITKRVARRVGGQVLIKTGGNNVDGFAVDIVCLGGRIFDILGDSENTAVPSWQDKGDAPGPCAPVPGVSEPPPPPPPPPPADDAVIEELRAQTALLNAIHIQLDTQAMLTRDTNAAVDKLRVDVIKATKDLLPQLLKVLPLLGALGGGK